LVEPTALLAGGVPVELVGVPEQVENRVDPFADYPLVELASLDKSPRICNLCTDIRLAGFEVLDRDRLGQVGVDELLLLPLQALEAPALLVDE
jgi:hypothetical protein